MRKKLGKKICSVGIFRVDFDYESFFCCLEEAIGTIQVEIKEDTNEQTSGKLGASSEERTRGHSLKSSVSSSKYEKLLPHHESV